VKIYRIIKINPYLCQLSTFYYFLKKTVGKSGKGKTELEETKKSIE
jgi:hypothetical protein